MSKVCQIPNKPLASPGRAIPITSCQSSVVLVSYSHNGTSTSFISYDSVASGRVETDGELSRAKCSETIISVVPSARANLSFNCPRPNRTEQPSQFKRPRVGTPIDFNCMSERVSDDPDYDSQDDSDFDLSSEFVSDGDRSISSFESDSEDELPSVDADDDEAVFGLAD